MHVDSHQMWKYTPGPVHGCGALENVPVFQFSDSFFLPVTNTKNLLQPEPDCERYENINDSYTPPPDPEEDWDSLPAPHPESDTEYSDINSDTILSVSHASTEEQNTDMFEQLRNLRNKNRKRPVLCYININSIRYKFDEVKEVLR